MFGPITLAAGTHTFHQNANAGEIEGSIAGGAFTPHQDRSADADPVRPERHGGEQYTGLTTIGAGTALALTTTNPTLTGGLTLGDFRGLTTVRRPGPVRDQRHLWRGL
ncbi:MAG: hypothetical protein U1F77_13680 [Kiritimatiellia bacterium]